MHLLEERASPQGWPSRKSRNFSRSLRELILLAPSGEPAPRLFVVTRTRNATKVSFRKCSVYAAPSICGMERSLRRR